MSNSRKLSRRKKSKAIRPKFAELSGDAQAVLRGMVELWVREKDVAKDIGMSEEHAVEAMMELIEWGHCHVVTSEPDAAGNFHFDIKLDYDRAPWLKWDN